MTVVVKLHASLRKFSPPGSDHRIRVELPEEASILERHDFGDGRARYEETPDEHHDHLIDVQSGKVIEFTSPEIEALQRKVAE